MAFVGLALRIDGEGSGDFQDVDTFVATTPAIEKVNADSEAACWDETLPKKLIARLDPSGVHVLALLQVCHLQCDGRPEVRFRCLALLKLKGTKKPYPALLVVDTLQHFFQVERLEDLITRAAAGERVRMRTTTLRRRGRKRAERRSSK